MHTFIIITIFVIALRIINKLTVNRSLKLWLVSDRQCLVTLGGHVHRISWVSIRPSNDVFVTGSLDFSLKVWNMKAVCEGLVPTVCGLHFTSLKTSYDGQYMVNSQGWARDGTITFLPSNNEIGHTASHNGFVDQAAFTRDSTRIITIDTGHTGGYEVENFL